MASFTKCGSVSAWGRSRVVLGRSSAAIGGWSSARLAGARSSTRGILIVASPAVETTPVDVVADYEEWFHRLCGYIRSRGCDEPEDVAQETILRCLRAARRGQVLIGAYVFKAARDATTDWRRTRSTQLEKVREAVGAYYQRRDPRDPNLSLVETLVDQPLASVPPNCADVLVLRAAGYSYPEIGGLLGITTIAVKKRVAYAQHKLRRRA
jgi:RNA polymerase sigma factor (sigma-70 family)